MGGGGEREREGEGEGEGGWIGTKLNECTKVQNPWRTRVRESMKVHALDLVYTFTESIRKTLGKRRRLNRKKLATLHRVVLQVEFSLSLAF